jgi:hypothetical protein
MSSLAHGRDHSCRSFVETLEPHNPDLSQRLNRFLQRKTGNQSLREMMDEILWGYSRNVVKVVNGRANSLSAFFRNLTKTNWD